MAIFIHNNVDEAFDVALDVESLKQRSVSGSLITTVAQLTKMVIQFGSMLILAHLLFPADYGLIAMVFPVIGFIQIFGDLGFAQAIIQRPALDQARVSALFWINLALGVTLGAFVAAIAPVVATLYDEPRVMPIMLVLSTIMPIAALGTHPAALLTRQMRFGVMAGHEIAAAVAAVAATIGTAFVGWSYWSIIAGTLAGTLITLGLNWLRCGWLPSKPKLVHSAWDDLKFGGGLTGANLATFFTTSGDNILIGVMTGKIALGLYDRSYKLAVQPLSQIVSPVSRVALPLLCRLTDQPAIYRRSYIEMFQALFLITAPIMLVCIINSAVLVDTLLGARWASAAPIFAWVCVGGLASGVYPSATWLFISQARTTAMMRYMALAAIINLVSFMLGAIGGIVWIAAAGGVGFVFVTTPLVLFGATRTGPVTAIDLLKTTGPIAIQCALASVAMLVQRQLGFEGFAQLVLATASCAMTFATTALVIPSQRRFVVKIVTILRF